MTSPLCQWEKNERRLFWTKAIQNTLKHRISGRIDTLSRNIMTDDPSSCHQSHFRSRKVTSSFSEMTFDRDQLEWWKHHRCVQVDNADRLICNMTFSGEVMTLTWGQIFNMTFQCQVIVHSTRLEERNMILVTESSCKVWVKSNCRKKTFFENNLLFLQFLPPVGKIVDGRLNLTWSLRKSVNKAIKCAFPRRCSFISFQAVRRFVENCRHLTYKSANFGL